MNNLYIYRLSMIVLIYRTTKIKRYGFVAMLLNVASAVLIYSLLKEFLIPKDKSMYAWDMQVCKCVLQTCTGVIWWDAKTPLTTLYWYQGNLSWSYMCKCALGRFEGVSL